MGDTTFVSVAGVWERLGYSGIKLSLETINVPHNATWGTFMHNGTGHEDLSLLIPLVLMIIMQGATLLLLWVVVLGLSSSQILRSLIHSKASTRVTATTAEEARMDWWKVMDWTWRAGTMVGQVGMAGTTVEKARMDCWKAMASPRVDCGHRRYTFPGRWKIQGHKAEVVDRVVFVAMHSPLRPRRRDNYQASRRHTHRACISTKIV